MLVVLLLRKGNQNGSDIWILNVFGRSEAPLPLMLRPGNGRVEPTGSEEWDGFVAASLLECYAIVDEQHAGALPGIGLARPRAVQSLHGRSNIREGRGAALSSVAAAQTGDYVCAECRFIDASSVSRRRLSGTSGFPSVAGLEVDVGILCWIRFVWESGRGGMDALFELRHQIMCYNVPGCSQKGPCPTLNSTNQALHSTYKIYGP